ncbi:MAG TPA: replication-relaxation family protein, partial [Acidimicrobiales bacterium]|nr:replication-relaxation family protein [Acidimicrobiales bacterium]
MRGEAAVRRVGPRELERLRDDLSGRDLAIVGQVAEFRLMSAGQIRAVHFALSEHDNELAAARACQRVLARLVRDRLLVRLERRVGGVRAGSASFVYGLAPVGQRVLALRGPRRRYHEPT